MNTPHDPTRREFLKAGTALGAGLTLGFHLTPARAAKRTVPTAAGEAFAPNAFIRVAPDNTVTVLVKHLEMGQGVQTGLPALVAEELEVPWESIRVQAAPADHTLYNNLFWGPMQGTGGSTAMGNSYEQLRRAGATAREMLREAAALTWRVDKARVRAEAGHIHGPAGQRLAYGALAEKAATLEPPNQVKLKPASQFKVIGKAFKRTDSKAKSDGSALFGMDLRLPGMLTAVVLRPPRFGDRLKSFDAGKALARPGVKAVFEIPSGVAVVAADTWSAIQGRLALKAEWEAGPAAGLTSTSILEDYRKRMEQPGAVARNDGDAAKALAGAAKTLVAEFEVPYLAHAPMEPLNCVVHATAAGCDIWTGDQFQTMDQKNAAAVLGLAPEQVRIHTLFAGGSFGRRANAKSDYVVEAVHVAKRMGVPVKTVWTREDDIRGGFYRPCYLHRLEAGLDGKGKPVAWKHRIVGQSIVAGTPFAGGMIKDGIDHTSVEGASTLPYAVPNLRVELHSPAARPCRCCGGARWASLPHRLRHRGVPGRGGSKAAGEDAVALRRKPAGAGPSAASGRCWNWRRPRAGWGNPLPTGEDGERRGRGIAVHRVLRQRGRTRWPR
jgi:isoquinoline 1-oxidoreductase beta subunit